MPVVSIPPAYESLILIPICPPSHHNVHVAILLLMLEKSAPLSMEEKATGRSDTLIHGVRFNRRWPSLTRHFQAVASSSALLHQLVVVWLALSENHVLLAIATNRQAKIDCRERRIDMGVTGRMILSMFSVGIN
jgi:hypothetical protein